MAPVISREQKEKEEEETFFWAPFSVSSAILDTFIQFNSLKSPMIKLSALQVRKLAKGT